MQQSTGTQNQITSDSGTQKGSMQRIAAIPLHFWSHSGIRAIVSFGIVVVALLFNLYQLTLSVPPTFALHSIFTIEEGMTLKEISELLELNGYVRSSFTFGLIVRAMSGERNIASGDYFFEQRISAIEIAKRMTNGDFGLTPHRVTIPEGFNKFQIAGVLQKHIPDFDIVRFLEIAKEGYLFPDTYFVLPNTTPEKIVAMMEENFDEKIMELQQELKTSGRTLDEVIKMASIVETEARIFETRQTIAGILWRRLDINMPLQVDVSFRYINGKGTAELTDEDLDSTSPYNSYRYVGLPPTPISNPGREAILATLTPIKTNYVYFLSDSEGVMHYAVTFDEHKKNKERFLR